MDTIPRDELDDVRNYIVTNGDPVDRSDLGYVHRNECIDPYQESVVYIAPPRQGKSTCLSTLKASMMDEGICAIEMHLQGYTYQDVFQKIWYGLPEEVKVGVTLDQFCEDPVGYVTQFDRLLQASQNRVALLIDEFVDFASHFDSNKQFFTFYDFVSNIFRRAQSISVIAMLGVSEKTFRELFPDTFVQNLDAFNFELIEPPSDVFSGYEMSFLTDELGVDSVELLKRLFGNDINLAKKFVGKFIDVSYCDEEIDWQKIMKDICEYNVEYWGRLWEWLNVEEKEFLVNYILTPNQDTHLSRNSVVSYFCDSEGHLSGITLYSIKEMLRRKIVSQDTYAQRLDSRKDEMARKHNDFVADISQKLSGGI